MKRVVTLPKTNGHEWVTARGQCVRTRPRSRKANKQALQGSMAPEFNEVVERFALPKRTSNYEIQ